MLMDDGEFQWDVKAAENYAKHGVAEGRLIYVAYTMRGDVIRIISARGAEPFERRKHHEENG